MNYTLTQHLIYYRQHIISRAAYETWLMQDMIQGMGESVSTDLIADYWDSEHKDIDTHLEIYVTKFDNRFDNLRECANEAVRLQMLAQSADKVLNNTINGKMDLVFDKVQEMKRLATMLYYEYMAFLSKWHMYAVYAMNTPEPAHITDLKTQNKLS